MPYFVVSYDLKTTGDEKRDYKPIEEALDKLDSCHTQDSVWYVERDGAAQELRDHLRYKLESRDRIMVIEFHERPSFINGKPGTKDWIDRRF